jgi:hypothetical protein
MPAGRDRTRPVGIELIDQAKENLILRRVTHLDQLADKLREERVRRVIEPMLAGTALGEVPEDDRQYLVDLGLLRRANGGGLVVANPIYREVLPRAWPAPRRIPAPDQPHLAQRRRQPEPGPTAQRFLDFWRQHGEPLLAARPTTRSPRTWC